MLSETVDVRRANTLDMERDYLKGIESFGSSILQAVRTNFDREQLAFQPFIEKS